MKALLSIAALAPLSLFAHPGHPGIEGHGDVTHVLLGLAFALPAALLLVGLKVGNRKKAVVKVIKQD